MALDPNIALGFRPMQIEQRNPMADYAQLAQLQNYQNQNQLAQFQMREAESAAQERNALRQLNPSAADYEAQLFKVNPQLGIAYRKESNTALAQEATRQKALIESATAKQKMLSQALRDISGRPSDANIMAHTEDIQTSPLFTEAEKQKALATQKTLLALPLEERTRFLSSQGATAGEMKPQLVTENLGATSRVSAIPAFGGAPTMVSQAPIEMSLAQIEQNKIAKRQADIAAQQASLAERKFAFEKANPGFELKENENGDFFGVNKRTLQAFPVTIGGGAAPAAAPMVPGAGMPGPRVTQPAAVVPAIPGMTSVLDQTAPASAPAAGGPRPLVGKGTAMTENQSKSAMFGAAMNQANNIISKVEKEGTTTAPVAVSVLQGLARLSPQFLGTGENAANAIESVFRQDPTSLLGPDVNQQKLGQAQIAFATAYLRATSGASFGPSEVSNTIKEYFPLVGEDKTVVKQKAQARQRAIEGMKISTNKQGQSYIDKSGANANDPLGLR